MKPRSVLKVRDRRCDTSCWKARETACDCICGGSNHGCGSASEARARTEQAAREGRYGDRIQQMRYLPATLRLRPDEIDRGKA